MKTPKRVNMLALKDWPHRATQPDLGGLKVGAIVEEEYIFLKKPKSNDSERDEYFLSDPQDFAEYSQRISHGSATKRRHNEFYSRIIQHFVGKPENRLIASVVT